MKSSIVGLAVFLAALAGCSPSEQASSPSDEGSVDEAALQSASEPNFCFGMDAPPPGSVPAPPQLTQFTAPLAGSYLCKAQYEEIPNLQAKHESVGVFKVKADLAGMWFRARYTEKKTPQNPTPYTNEEFITYDSVSATFLRTFHGTFGDQATLTSPGFDNTGVAQFAGSLAFSTPAGRTSVPWREQWKKVGTREIVFSGSISLDGGTTFLPQFSIDCTRIL